MAAAVENGFQVLVTLDSGIPDQQRLSSYAIGVVVLAIHPATPSRLADRMDRVADVLSRAAAERTTLKVE